MSKQSVVCGQRDTRVDSIKFFLILFVILGHLLEVGWDNVVNEKLYSFIYSFHMPAFIILSGYFFKKTEKKRFWRGILNLVVTYGIFQVLYFGNPMVYRLWGGNSLTISGLYGNVTSFYKPAAVLWYVVSLISWRIVSQYIPQGWLDDMRKMLVAAVVMGILAAFVPLGRELSFQRTFAFYPYFLLGYYMRTKGWWEKLQETPIWLSCVVVLLYVGIIIVGPYIPKSMLVQFYSYQENHLIPLLRVVSYLWMLPLTLAILRLLPDVGFCASEGKNTMFYYIFHVYFVYIEQRLVVDCGFPITIPYILLYWIVSVVALYLLSKVRLFDYLLNPIRTHK